MYMTPMQMVIHMIFILMKFQHIMMFLHQLHYGTS